jgi:hemolysin activation/secretion protein
MFTKLMLAQFVTAKFVTAKFVTAKFVTAQFITSVLLGNTLLWVSPATAQTQLPPTQDRNLPPPSQQPLPEQLPKPEPPPAIDLPKLPIAPPGSVETIGSITVQQFQIEGSRVFSQAKIDQITQAYRNRPLTFPELLQVATIITKLYVDNGYITTGAFIPSDRIIANGIVPVQVVEGRLAATDIRVRFKAKDGSTQPNGRLRAAYIRDRMALATQTPLQRQRLIDGLQLLQLNPLIQDVKAELSEGNQPGQSVLNLEIVERPRTWSAQALLDNGRSPSVGSFRRRFSFIERNLTGRGDAFTIAYTNTKGSHSGDISYTIPVNPRNGTVNLSLGLGSSEIVEEPFDILDITTRSSYLELTYRQPVIETPREELALGFTFSRQAARATISDGEIPFPVAGSDFEGRTRVTALRFFQEWSQRSDRTVLALRSQFSTGLNLFGATDNEEPPDGQFIAWRGQAQWTRLLAPETLLVVRGDLQFANRALPPIEQFGIGGANSVRGYRQDRLLTDSGLFASAELRVPIARFPKLQGLLQVAPFVEIGTGWNRSGFDNPDPPTLASAGLGLRLNLNQTLDARLDWGIPLTATDRSRDSLQERGLHFSLTYTPF